MIPEVIRGKVDSIDLVQEVFLDAQCHAKVMPSDDSDQLRAWLYRIIVLNLAKQKRLAATSLRFRSLGSGRSDDSLEGRGCSWVADEQPTSGATSARKEPLDRLIGAIRELPDADQKVVFWRYRDRLTFAEVGRRLGGCSDEAASKQHVRACKKRYAILGDRF